MSKLFLFVDESGDAGSVGKDSSSDYYQLNIIACDANGVRDIVYTLSNLRYFINLKRELKEYWHHDKIRPKMVSAIEKSLINNESIKAFVFCVDKKKYVGRYLGQDSVKFQNFILRKALGYIFDTYVDSAKIDSLELVLDRYLSSEIQQGELKKYLHKSYELPRSREKISKLHFIVHVQSVYCEPVQYADIIGRYYVDIKHHVSNLVIIDFSSQKRKKTGTSTRDTKSSSPIGT